MLNALRLTNGFPKDLFTKRTALPLKSINSALQRAITNNYLQITDRHINPTEHGKRFLDNLCQLFLA